MATIEKNVHIQYAPEEKQFIIRIERENEKSASFRLDGTDARHLYNGLGKALNTRPRSEDDWKSLEAEYLAEKARRDNLAPVPPSAPMPSDAPTAEELSASDDELEGA
jgi:23S rRNA A2030 N6-methylase RlmJ